ncbi:hypothetical protein PMAA_088020 [Talaromyces marneffei ATCC 18224]|uniref:Uncharacterized protein n=2 Tax=Talaromyces marneffei TaxID=37727 RepID=B6QDR8_TALMQ|nr:hypothetical protein PMAA_088020 [Talaromyces marneffei ATCC 18224]
MGTLWIRTTVPRKEAKEALGRHSNGVPAVMPRTGGIQCILRITRIGANVT